jgi:hypothetical protein
MARVVGRAVARFSRRRALLGSLALLSTVACVPASPHPSAPTPALPTEFDGWGQEAKGMLSDVLDALRTFDTFQAFRVTTADASSLKLAAELAWDPPSSTDWDAATHVIRGLHGRAGQLFAAVTTAPLDPSLWREQRMLADATHDLLDLADVVGEYRNRVDVLPPGDASSMLALLDSSWSHWDAVAARWGMSRAELVTCAA